MDVGEFLLSVGAIFLLFGSLWLLTPKNERPKFKLFNKSGKLYNDGDNT